HPSPTMLTVVTLTSHVTTVNIRGEHADELPPRRPARRLLKRRAGTAGGGGRQRAVLTRSGTAGRRRTLRPLPPLRRPRRTGLGGSRRRLPRTRPVPRHGAPVAHNPRRPSRRRRRLRPG